MMFPYLTLQDKAIRAVRRANEGGYKYHIVTGAAGSVSPSKSILADQCAWDFDVL